MARKPARRRDTENTAPFADYVVYYDINTGEMLFNGVHKSLKKTNKALFDALFLASPNYIDRKKLLSILGTTKKVKSSKIVLNEALTNLRKLCGVKKHVIQLRSEGGRLRNVETHPLSAQTPTPIPTPTPRPTVLLNPIADAHVRSDLPTQNLGSEANLLSDGDPDSNVFLKFNLSELDHEDIYSAKLRVHITNASVDDHEVRAMANTSWGENNTNYFNRPSWGDTVGVIESPSANIWKEVEITQLVEANKGFDLSLAIIPASGGLGDGATFASREHGVNTQPQLVVELGNSTSTTLGSIDDTHVRADMPTENWGNYADALVDANPESHAYLKFDATALANKTIKSAKVRLHVTNSSVDTHVMYLVENNSSWSESYTLYATKPLLDTAVLGQLDNPTANQWVEIDLTSVLTQFKGQAFSVGISPSSGASGDGVTFATKEHGIPSIRPQLVIEYVE